MPVQVPYTPIRTTASRCHTAVGATCKRTVLGLGSLEGLTKAQRDRLADLLTMMIEKGETALCEDGKLYEMALGFYNTYRETKYGKEKLDPKLKADAERKAAEERRDLVTIKLSSLTQREARTIGPVEALYYLKKAEGYEREAAYYTKNGNVDMANTYSRYAKTARDNYKTQMGYARQADARAADYLKYAREALSKANK